MSSTGIEQTFLDERPRLFRLAYRLMGTVADAEDALQDVFLRLRSSAAGEIAAPSSYLTRAVVHRCLDGWKSARRKREKYIGQWLPEPLSGDDPQHRQHLADDVSLAFLVILEALNPVERAVFLLHDVFQYSFDEVATIVEKSPAACRQIGSRARGKVADNRPRLPASPDEHERLVGRFLAACQSGDLSQLTAVLAEDVTVYSDGGGLTPAARVPIEGINRVTRFIAGLRSKSQHQGEIAELRPAEVNGTPGILYFIDGRLHAVLSLEVDGGRIRRLYSVLNPEKLATFHVAKT